MKKLFLSIALLASLSASALEVKLERVSYRNEKYGSSVDKTKEIEFRKAKIAEYKKLGYAFDGMIAGSNGKFMKFVK